MINIFTMLSLSRNEHNLLENLEILTAFNNVLCFNYEGPVHILSLFLYTLIFHMIVELHF